jgi:ketosteroid isomerase-like protein
MESGRLERQVFLQIVHTLLNGFPIQGGRDMIRNIRPITFLIIASVTVAFGRPSHVNKGEPEMVNRNDPVSKEISDMVTNNATRPSDAESVLRQIEREWNEALKTRDVEWFERNLASDVTDISSGNGALHTKTEDIEGLKADKTVYESLELSNLKVRVEGNAGVVTGINHIKGRDEQGNAFDVRLSFTDTYIKREGRWQVWASQHTRLRP